MVEDVLVELVRAETRYQWLVFSLLVVATILSAFLLLSERESVASPRVKKIRWRLSLALFGLGATTVVFQLCSWYMGTIVDSLRKAQEQEREHRISLLEGEWRARLPRNLYAQKKAFQEELIGLKPRMIQLSVVAHDTEAFHFAISVMAVLQEAGWPIQHPIVRDESVQGMERIIQIWSSTHSSREEEAIAFQRAFKAARFKAQRVGHFRLSDDYLRIHIGSHPTR
jgi:hypothetical protein